MKIHNENLKPSKVKRTYFAVHNNKGKQIQVKKRKLTSVEINFRNKKTQCCKTIQNLNRQETLLSCRLMKVWSLETSLGINIYNSNKFRIVIFINLAT